MIQLTFILLVLIQLVYGQYHIPMKRIHMDVENVKNIQYIAKLYIGTPKQEFDVLIDTGSANLWIPSGVKTSKCCGPSKHQYHHENSKSYTGMEEEIHLIYGSGEVKGFQSTDVVEFGGLIAEDMVFTEVTNQRGYGLVSFDGILGLSFNTLAIHETPTLMDRLGVSDFSMYLSSDAAKVGSTFTSTLILGGVDNNLFEGSIDYFKLLRHDFWVVTGLNQVHVDGYGNQSTCSSSLPCNVIFDSGTSWISGPRSILGNIQKLTMPEQDCSNLMYLPDVSFVINDISFSLTPYDYTVQAYIPSLDQTFCQSGFQLNPDGSSDPDSKLTNTVVLGDSFLRSYYTHYDIKNSRVGLAKSKQQQGEPDAELFNKILLRGIHQ